MVCGVRGYGASDLEEAHQRVVRGSHFLLVVQHLPPAFHGHFHIRLSAAEPHFTSHHIFEYGLLAIVEGDGVGSARPRHTEVEGEGSCFLVGLHLHGLLIPRGGDFYGGILLGGSRQVHRRLLLEYHVRGHPPWQFHFCLCGHGHEAESE